MREEWIENIQEHILSYGFQETDDGRYEIVSVVQQPGQTISINGRVMQQEGKKIEIKHLVTLMGDGWISNEGDSDKEDFTQIKFESYQDDKLVLEYEEAIYWDDINYFKNIFNRIFE